MLRSLVGSEMCIRDSINAEYGAASSRMLCAQRLVWWAAGRSRRAKLHRAWTSAVPNSPSGSKKCDPHGLGGIPLDRTECDLIVAEHHPKWSVLPEGQKIRRDFHMADFEEAMSLVQVLGHVVQCGTHHPDIHVEKMDWRTSSVRVSIESWSPRLGGLSYDDFALAMQIDENVRRAFPSH
eukprot:TRINITY_DN37241_c0_g1_i1.p1 TRINITY_DN37241_c0_g1~~TRINITY_DN37241_c0_g1_i1.p1  ORF type:complete len:209 (-),score=39.26 TRINITY_DN37241_c0_g1_i1:155-694(-)